MATVPSQVRGHRSDERISGGVHEHRKQHRVRTGHGQILRLQAPYLQCDSNRSALRAADADGSSFGRRDLDRGQDEPFVGHRGSEDRVGTVQESDVNVPQPRESHRVPERI